MPCGREAIVAGLDCVMERRRVRGIVPPQPDEGRGDRCHLGTVDVRLRVPRPPRIHHDDLAVEALRTRSKSAVVGCSGNVVHGDDLRIRARLPGWLDPNDEQTNGPCAGRSTRLERREVSAGDPAPTTCLRTSSGHGVSAKEAAGDVADGAGTSETSGAPVAQVVGAAALDAHAARTRARRRRPHASAQWTRRPGLMIVRLQSSRRVAVVLRSGADHGPGLDAH